LRASVSRDRGGTAVRVTLVPLLVALQSGTRESVMDKQPWTYQRMADELQEEGKTAVYGDVREYLYVDAKLTLSDGAVAAIARGGDGIWGGAGPRLRAETTGYGGRRTAVSRISPSIATDGSASPFPIPGVPPISGLCVI